MFFVSIIEKTWNKRLTKKRIMRGGEKGKNNSVNFKKSKNKKFEILIVGFILNKLNIFLYDIQNGKQQEKQS